MKNNRSHFLHETGFHIRNIVSVFLANKGSAYLFLVLAIKWDTTWTTSIFGYFHKRQVSVYSRIIDTEELSH